MSEPRIDWFMLFRDLNNEGYSFYSLSVLIGIPKSTLCGWSGGAEPRYHDGERLIQFWCEATGKARQELPKTEHVLSANKVK
jgi:hypothetical protein